MSFLLGADEVHVWTAPLGDPGRLDRLARLLAAEERARAERYVHPAVREQFVVARAMLRTLLGRYLGLLPAEVRLGFSDLGKPHLVGGELHFNISHTHGLALLALTRRGEVGVDVEQLRPSQNHLDIAGRFFSPREAQALHALPAQQREEAFFQVWTRKEAFLKATGLGLSHGLERFEVAVPPDDPPRILHIDGDAQAGARWSLVSLVPRPGYVAAVATQGPPVRVVVRTWQGE